MCQVSAKRTKEDASTQRYSYPHYIDMPTYTRRSILGGVASATAGLTSIVGIQPRYEEIPAHKSTRRVSIFSALFKKP